MKRNIERKIIIGLITQDDFIKQVYLELKSEYFVSDTAKILWEWCRDYFSDFQKSPGVQIENIFFEKVRSKTIPDTLAEELEQNILPGLSEEYEKENVNIKLLVKQTRRYVKERKLQILKDELEVLIDKGEYDIAEKKVESFQNAETSEDEVSLNNPEAVVYIREAMDTTRESVIVYPGVIGTFWNNQMIKGGFVALLAPEKRSKSMFLLDAAMRASKQGKQVAFFQAGDMTRSQQIRRILLYISHRTDKEEQVGIYYTPIKDCVKNQLNTCNKHIRECNFGIFEDKSWDEATLKKEVTKDMLIEIMEQEKDYLPCYNCRDYITNSYGTIYYQKTKIKLLSVKEAERKWKEQFIKNNRDFKLSTHANGTLTVGKIKQILYTWKIKDGFHPDLIVIDYADLLEIDQYREERHKQNMVWKQLRGLSQEQNALLLTATQSDAASYEQDTLSLKNFSEDKRKYAHVTAMYGLNQDKSGREKKLGILRINELVLREDEFDINRQVKVLQNLRISRPVLDSYL